MNETITIGGNRSIYGQQERDRDRALQRTHTVGINETISVGAAQEITVGGAQAITVGARPDDDRRGQPVNERRAAVDVGRTCRWQPDDHRRRECDDDRRQGRGAKGRRADVRPTSARTTRSRSRKKLIVDAGDSVMIKTGDASITMKKDGTIVDQGQGHHASRAAARSTSRRQAIS